MMKKLLILLIICSVGMVSKAQNTMNIYQNNGTVLQIPLSTIDSITYTLGNPGNIASITTLPIGNITASGASSGGNITNDGGSPVTQRGICWSTSQNPTTANTSTSNGSGVGSYVSSLTGLTANTTYYVRAYAINSAGTAYGNQVSFTTIAGGGGILTNPGAGVTFDGYIYSSVVLGNGQEWMAENLRTTVYANGDLIPNVTDITQWSNLTTGAWAHYANDNQYENPYGKLYNWYTVADPRGVCPTGWHVPTDTEWTDLTNYLGGETIAGGKMKSTSTQYWQSPNQDATNESGFSGLPGGGRSYLGDSFNFIGDAGYWWSSTEFNTNFVWFRYIEYTLGNAYRDNNEKAYGYSIRCIRN